MWFDAAQHRHAPQCHMVMHHAHALDVMTRMHAREHAMGHTGTGPCLPHYARTLPSQLEDGLKRNVETDGRHMLLLPSYITKLPDG
jgi:hypothetical protein